MKFGMKIPADTFSEKMGETARKICSAFGGKSELLSFLRANVDNVELGVIGCDWDAEIVKNAACECAKCGLSVTIHGSMDGAASSEEFFAPYVELFASKLQDVYNITVHPFKSPDETVEFLKKICDCADENGYPVRITLENQRYSNESKKENLCRHVADIVTDVASPHLFTCFDFGHHLSNLRTDGEDFDKAEDKFLSQIRHTHIHSRFDGKTHFPLSCGEVLLEQNLTELISRGYDGVFLLELAPDRYWDKFDIKESFITSISILKAAVYQVKRKLEIRAEYKKDFSSRIKNVRKLAEKSRCGIGAIGPAAYILKMGNTKIAIDPSLWDIEASDGEFIEALKACDAIVITHADCDHYDASVLDALGGKVPLYIPDFIDYKGKNVIYVSDGDTKRLGDCELTFFDSAHTADRIVPEYGFAAFYDGKSYVFPADVREYQKAHPIFENTEALVAHLWLGKANALNLHDNPYIGEFCDFVNSFEAKKVLLGHMLDFRRTIEDMWSEIHYKAVESSIPESRILKLGDFAEF